MDRKEWLAWRKKGIGSSDAPILMNVSKWSTPFKLWEEKLSDSVEEDDSNSFIKDKGNEFEVKVRSYYNLVHDDSCEPCLVEKHVEGVSRPFLASFDGRSEDKKRGIEIKLLGKEDFALLQSGVLMPHYKPQVHHQLFVGDELEYITVVGYLYDKEDQNVDSTRIHELKVYRDQQYGGELFSETIKFMDCLDKKKPPQLSDKDYKTLQVKGTAALVNKWKQLKLKAEKIDEEITAIRSKIEEICESEKHPRLQCAGVRFAYIPRVGAVDYAKVPELKGVDLDKYRKKGSASWKFDLIKTTNEEEK